MLLTWKDGASMGWVVGAYALIGSGVGLCVTPASRSLMSSVPPVRGGMGSAFLDLTRDFGGAIMQAVMGALLAGAYAARIGSDLAALSPQDAAKVSDDTADALTSSFQSAEQVAQQYPDYASQITSAAADAFTSGKSAAMLVALAMALIGLALVVFVYPRKEAEEAYYAKVASESA
jgi:MFS transporter, DHA2 family, multidrug resistance protein